MTARHAGESRIADQALIDQVRAAVADLRTLVNCPCWLGTCAPGHRHCIHGDRMMQLAKWAGRALALLEQIGEMGE